MITLHLEAETLAELRVLVQRVLDQTNPVFDHKHPDKGDFGMLDASEPQENRQENRQESPPERAKARRPHRRVRPVEAPVATPVAAPAPDPDPLEEAFSSMPSPDAIDAGGDLPDDVDEVDNANAIGDARTAVDNELLKRAVISSLADMFTAGNVKVVRHVLHKYGHGAKSFPEIDPVHFPEIKAALDRNEAA